MQDSNEGAVLYIVATPIGNLDDMSARAIEVLKRVDLIAAEDTRHSKRLMQHFAVNTQLTSHHDFSSAAEVQKLLDHLASGKSLALISDAGTPLISDPGYQLVSAARSLGVEVLPIPGPSAVIAALSVAGIACDRFRFEGFLPAKSAQRLKRLQALAAESATLVFYESPHRIAASLADFVSVFGADEQRQLFVARELTKKFESHCLGSVAQVADWAEGDTNNTRGEFVLVLSGASVQDAAEQEAGMQRAQEIARLLRADLSLKRAVALAAEIAGVRKNALYALMLQEAD
jgi:16S rRNA (cytidine1402-2'-O)-methyltransferase